MKNVKVEKCLSISCEEDTLIKVFKSGFRNPQMYYMFRETAFDSPSEVFAFVNLQQLAEELSITEEEILKYFEI